MFNPGSITNRYRNKVYETEGGKKAMEQLQFNGVVLGMVRFFKRQVIETPHMII